MNCGCFWSIAHITGIYHLAFGSKLLDFFHSLFKSCCSFCNRVRKRITATQHTPHLRNVSSSGPPVFDGCARLYPVNNSLSTISPVSIVSSLQNCLPLSCEETRQTECADWRRYRRHVYRFRLRIKRRTSNLQSRINA